jgi:hypothetical protein
MSILESCLSYICEDLEAIPRSDGTQDRQITDGWEKQLNPHGLGSGVRSYKLASDRAAANATVRPPVPKSGSKELLINFERANTPPIGKAGKPFVPAWKQKSVDEINRIRRDRRGESPGALRAISIPIYGRSNVETL